MRPPPPPPSRPLLPPRAQRASGREASGRTACCEAPSGSIKESNIDDGPGRYGGRRAPVRSRRARGGREGGRDGRREGAITLIQPTIK